MRKKILDILLGIAVMILVLIVLGITLLGMTNEYWNDLQEVQHVIY